MDKLIELGNDMLTADFALRCSISGFIAASLYLLFAYVTHRLYPRKVDRDIYESTLTSDIVLGLISVLSGSPMLQAFELAHRKWNIAKVYTNISEYGIEYWLISIPLYLLLWDLVFYVTHLFLHWGPIYRFSHSNHHAFRPPVAWSGIAIDPFETIFSGILPYIVPLFVLPFHLHTVYAVNILLVGWATMLHSSCPWAGNWLMIGARDHNVHHARGLDNANFAAIFKIWDRMFGTLDTTMVPFWYVTEQGLSKGGSSTEKGSSSTVGSPSTAAATVSRTSPSNKRSSSTTRPALKSRQSR